MHTTARPVTAEEHRAVSADLTIYTGLVLTDMLRRNPPIGSYNSPLA